MIMGHGGNKTDLAKKMGCSIDDIIDMSSNLNPLGPPEKIETIICNNLDKIRSLPEPDAASMRKGFADFHGIDPGQVAAGNGTTWFIYTIPKALGSKKILISGPSYSDYKDACLMHKIDFDHCLARESDLFEPDIDYLSRMVKGVDMVFICNPNNPTGVLIPKEKLAYLIQKHKGTCFVVDESYLPFVDRADEISLVSETGYQNLIVLSSMSKIFRIPGLRTGFLSAHKSLAEKIMVFSQPWSVNALAQAVIEFIFDHPEDIDPFYRKTREYIRTEKQVFLSRLEGVNDLQIFDSCTYFLLARINSKLTSQQFCDRIGRGKILIRDCSNFFGLSGQHVRFSLKERLVNLRLADLIKQSLEI